MAQVQLVTRGGDTTALDDSIIEDLQLQGAAIGPGDDGYEEARTVWNAMIDRKPGLILRCSGVADVISAVNLAREHDLLVSVRGGGHNAAGLAICDGGLVIDLSPMKGIHVDPVKRVAHAQAGATWADFDRETHVFGLATTGGAISTTGIAGLTLGGGLGWLMRSCGLACDNLLSVNMVTADGRLVRSSEDENPDLFWGVRGGGGNFGIIASFEYQLHPVETVLGGMVVHPIERAKETLQFYREFTQSAPDQLTAFSSLLTTPDGVPAVAIVVCYNGLIEEGERVIEPLRKFGQPLADEIGSMPYPKIQKMLDEGFPPGNHVYWRSQFLESLDDAVIDDLVAQFKEVTSPLSALVLEQLGGAVSRVSSDATAFEHRDAPYNLAIIGQWADEAEAERNIDWTRAASEAMKPHARGVYVNYLGVGESAGRVRSAYSPATYERLVALKNKYDPTNMFRLNQNIPPSV